MIDILVYLFETYGYADACPAEPEQLHRKLTAAGFEEGEVTSAIEWLSGLRSIAAVEAPAIAPDSRSFRVFCDEELAHIDADCRGFLHFLETAGVLDARQRELIIDRAMALFGDEMTLGNFKVIVLMVLWQQQASMDTLILEELLTDEAEDFDDEAELLSVH